MRAYSIGETSARTGVNIETIRYYERIAIMPRADRTPGGNRQYGQDMIKRLSFIKRCRELGFTLAEIRALLGMADDNDFTCQQVHDITMSHVAGIENKISDLKRLEATLKSMAAQCSKGDVPDCPVIDALFEG